MRVCRLRCWGLHAAGTSSLASRSRRSGVHLCCLLHHLVLALLDHLCPLLQLYTQFLSQFDITSSLSLSDQMHLLLLMLSSLLRNIAELLYLLRSEILHWRTVLHATASLTLRHCPLCSKHLHLLRCELVGIAHLRGLHGHRDRYWCTLLHTCRRTTSLHTWRLHRLSIRHGLIYSWRSLRYLRSIVPTTLLLLLTKLPGHLILRS